MKHESTQSVLALNKNIKVKKLIKILTVTFFLILLFISITPWQQTAISHGEVIAYSPSERQQEITALFDGRIEKWYVNEGSQVTKGEKIAEIVDNDPNIFKNLHSEKNALLSKKLALSNALAIAKINVDRQKSLFEDGIAARKTFEIAQIEYAKIQGEIAGLDSLIAQIDVRLSRQDAHTIKAPITGVIIRRISADGSSFVKAGEGIATLVPETNSRAVALFVNPNDMPLIQKGQHVRLQFEGWPAIQFSGWPSVAVGTFGGVVDFVDAASDARGKFRILVVKEPNEAWPEPKYLRQGIRVNAWILIGKVKLGYEIWRQFNGFPPSIEKEK